MFEIYKCHGYHDEQDSYLREKRPHDERESFLLSKIKHQESDVIT